MRKTIMLAMALAIGAAPLAFASNGSTQQDPGDWRDVAPQPDTNPKVLGLFDGHATPQQMKTEQAQWGSS